MNIFSPVDVQIIVIYMYFIGSVFSRIMPFILELQFQSTSNMTLAEHTVSCLLKFSIIIGKAYFLWNVLTCVKIWDTA